MYDNPASRDFQSLLPMTLQFKDFNNTEKTAYPPRALSIEKTPAKFEPSVGELTVFVPWGNLVIFTAILIILMIWFLSAVSRTA